MKLVFFYGNLLRGGAQRVMCELANQFSAWGDQMTLLTMDAGKCEYELSPSVKVQGLGLAGDSANKLESLSRMLNTLLVLRRWERQERPDAVICFSTHLSFQLSLALTGCRDRCSIIASERANPQFRRKGALDRVERRYMEKLDGIIFQTQRVSMLFSESLRERGRVIHNGLFSRDIPEKVTDYGLRDRKRICAMGRLGSQKANDTMIKAFAIFARSHPEHVLNIYGRGREGVQEKLQKLAEEQGVGSRVVFHGSLPDVLEHVKDAGMFLMTSRFEGMPNALMEAMACGIPCVCTDCDFGPAELIEDGVSGLLVPVDDVEAIAAAMARIADEPGLGEKLSEAALKIRQTHSREEICRQYHDYIEKTVNRRR